MKLSGLRTSRASYEVNDDESLIRLYVSERIEAESRVFDAAQVSSSPLLPGDSPRRIAPFAGTLSNPGLNSASLRREELDRVFHGGG